MTNDSTSEQNEPLRRAQDILDQEHLPSPKDLEQRAVFRAALEDAERQDNTSCPNDETGRTVSD